MAEFFEALILIAGMVFESLADEVGQFSGKDSKNRKSGFKTEKWVTR